MRYDCMATIYEPFWWGCWWWGRLCPWKGAGCMDSLCTCHSSLAQEVFGKQLAHGIWRYTNSLLSWCVCVWQFYVWCRLVLNTTPWSKFSHTIIPILLKRNETWGDWVTLLKVTINLGRAWEIGHYTMMLSQATKHVTLEHINMPVNDDGIRKNVCRNFVWSYFISSSGERAKEWLCVGELFVCVEVIFANLFLSKGGKKNQLKVF